jgi:hypothetical protein
MEETEYPNHSQTPHKHLPDYRPRAYRGFIMSTSSAPTSSQATAGNPDTLRQEVSDEALQLLIRTFPNLQCLLWPAKLTSVD